MHDWFESKFEKDFFKGGIYVDGKHVLDDYKNMFSKNIIKGMNPRARMEPTVQFDYDRENLDSYMAPPNLYLRKSKYNQSFFKDYDRDMFLGIVMRALRMDFNFKVRVSTRSEQLDVFNRMEMYFRVGSTMHENVSVDYHVPKAIMINIADRAGFEIRGNEVVDAISFINYLNSIFPGYVQNHIYYQLHEEKIHGIDIEGITDNIKIVVVPDASSNEEDKHKILKEKGVDVLVIDHHIADSVSKYACVINNQLCDYPNKSLCGTAMVYKFCCFLDQILNEDKANNFLDLTALALIADMMDLREFETHRLVEIGLKQLYNPFFKAL